MGVQKLEGYIFKDAPPDVKKDVSFKQEITDYWYVYCCKLYFIQGYCFVLFQVRKMKSLR